MSPTDDLLKCANKASGRRKPPDPTAGSRRPLAESRSSTGWKPVLHGFAACAVLSLATAAASAAPVDAPKPADRGARPVVAPKPTGETRDILYLADEGLIILRLRIEIGGKGFRTLWSESIDTLFDSLDADGDGVLAGDETAAVPSQTELAQARLVASRPGGTLPTNNPNTADTSPRDGQVTRDEFRDYLRRIGAGEFTLESTSAQETMRGVVNRARQQGDGKVLFGRLDRDGDGKLSRAELESAGKSLHKFDFDDDETISKSEIGPFQSPYYAVAVNSGGVTIGPGREPFMDLGADDSPAHLVRRVIDKYDRPAADSAPKDGKLTPQELGLAPAVVEKHDADGDGRLDSTELRRFFENPTPTLELHVRIAEKRPTAAGVYAETSVAPPGVQVRSTPDRTVSLGLGKVHVEIAASGSGIVTRPAYKQIFEQADADGNGYLDETEARRNAFFRGSFKLMDRDRDGMVFEKEMLAFFEKRALLARARTVLTVADQGRDLFKILDIDRDDRLNRRELRAALGRVPVWDVDGDGQVADAEIPQQYRLSAGRGQAGVAGASIVVTRAVGGRAAARSVTSGPAWFQKMDRNRDGDVSRREFLGPLEAFNKLDKNGDGLIDPAEAAAQ